MTQELLKNRKNEDIMKKTSKYDNYKAFVELKIKKVFRKKNSEITIYFLLFITVLFNNSFLEVI